MAETYAGHVLTLLINHSRIIVKKWVDANVNKWPS